MELTFGDVQETALIPLAIKASETERSNARIVDLKAKEIIDALGVDVSKYDCIFRSIGKLIPFETG